jgi:hypothetical protein
MKGAILALTGDKALAGRLVEAGRARVKADFPCWDDVAKTVLERLRAMAG